MLDAAKALAREGAVPPGVDNPEVYRQRSGWTVLPRGVDYWEGTRDMRKAPIPQAAEVVQEIPG